MSFVTTLLDEVMAGFEGNTGTKGAVAKEMLGSFQQNEGGGLAGLVSQLNKKGLSDIVQSWIGTGPNKDISPEQLNHAMDNNTLQQLAAKFGIPPEMVTTYLADVLPKIVDRLTPSGQLPSMVPGMDSEKENIEP
jgi:uncharacterized protein YidB (DUF937 family)